MNQQLPFRTQARTVDHLGREQIADSPTAISELWKNAYDAYARGVSLHIFDSPSICACIFDDGLGMSREDFTDRWLVLGTSSKIDRSQAELSDTKGLPRRESQGQKGIGRLSVAFLGPLLLLLSKKTGSGYIASLIDWRLFENPYLLLEDVRIPFAEVGTSVELRGAFAGLSEDLVDNVWGRNGSEGRNQRVVDAWAKFDEQETKAGVEVLTSLQIASGVTEIEFSDELIENWPAWSDAAETGTALIIFEVKEELRAWLRPSVSEDEETSGVKLNLQRTLTGFVDPFSDEAAHFEYRAVVHRGTAETIIVDSANQFGRSDLYELEHFIDGSFDEFGTFSGRVKAFGRDLGQVVVPPAGMSVSSRNTRVGPFAFAIGTFEQEAIRSTHELAIHSALKERADASAGLRIYRDRLRVMPYGRPDVDFFGIEERRTLNAGREFWQNFRVFGRIAITRKMNPNLRDKAGREGFIDNSARRRLRLLVIGLLMRTARQFFGSSSDYREKWLPEIMAANKIAHKAETAVRTANRKELIEHIRSHKAPLLNAITDAKALQSRLAEAREQNDADAFASLAPTIDVFLEARSEYRPPSKPAKLGKLEDEYREYRDSYNSFTATIDVLTNTWNEATAEFGAVDPISTAQRTLSRYQKLLSNEIGQWASRIKSTLNAEIISLQSKSEVDRGEFYQRCQPLLEDLKTNNSSLSQTLVSMDVLREELHSKFENYYVSYFRGLERVTAGIDVDIALTWGAEARSALEQRVDQLNALAQLGITVEIIGHEFETLDAQVGRNLRKLPTDVRQSDAYKLAMEGYQALATRLHFLSPLRIAGTQFRESISGQSIADYMQSFFAQQIGELGVDMNVSDSFKSATVVDFRYRIIPVFVNLINNALYWVKYSVTREIMLDFRDGEMIVADTGRGVDPDDVDQLFEIFFTRRASGRGVGLYLCRANLAASGHVIRYQSGGPSLSGANFCINIASEFNG